MESRKGQPLKPGSPSSGGAVRAAVASTWGGTSGIVGSQLQQSQLLREVRSCPGPTFKSVELSCKEYGRLKIILGSITCSMHFLNHTILTQ